MKQREIKFRVWDKLKKIFLPDDVYAIINRTSFNAFGQMITDWEDYKEGEYFYDNAQELVLFTGLKDKNGVEIYLPDVASLTTPPGSAMEDVFNEIRQERTKQDAKWGEQNHAPADWLMILGEEVGEVNKAALEAKFGSSTLREYREELVQVASVTVAMIECFDRNHLPPPPSK